MTSTPQLPALGVALLLLASCAGSGTPTSEATPSTAPSPGVSVKTSATEPSVLKPVAVHIRSFAYVPAAPVVIVGQPIKIINDDVAAHTWSAAPGAGWVYTSGNLEKGQRATFPGFTKPGRLQISVLLPRRDALDERRRDGHGRALAPVVADRFGGPVCPSEPVPHCSPDRGATRSATARRTGTPPGRS